MIQESSRLQSEECQNTVRSYVQRDALNTADISAVYKIARAFDVTIEDLVEILEDGVAD